MLFNRVPNIDRSIISVHCHNDLGLAVANSLSAVRRGARQVECTINGLGERAGNAAMEEIVMALRTRHDRLPFVNNIKTEHIAKGVKLVSTVTGFVIQPNKAIVGKNAFAHESGIHQDGFLKHARTYEIMTPESVGFESLNLVMGKHSGRHAFKKKLVELGYDLDDEAVEDAFKRFKAVADMKKDIFDEDISALVDDSVVRVNDRVKLVSLEIRCGSGHSRPKATMALDVEGDVKETEQTGDGPVDAAFNCVKTLFPHEARLQLYQVHAVTQGADAQGGDRAIGRRRPHGQWPRRRYAYHGRFREGLCHRVEQTAGETRENGPGGTFGLVSKRFPTYKGADGVGFRTLSSALSSMSRFG